MKQVIVYGNGQYARIMHQIQSEENSLSIAAYTADRIYIEGDQFLGLPLIDFEEVESRYSPEAYDMLVLVGRTRMRDRRRMFEKAKAKGYHMPNYIGPRANVSGDLMNGENNLVFNGAYLGPFGRMGSNNIIRPNAYVGHGFRIGDHTYVAPGCNIGGDCVLGSLSFLGIGSTVIEKTVIAPETLIGAGSLVLGDTDTCAKYYGSPARKRGEHTETGIVF